MKFRLLSAAAATALAAGDPPADADAGPEPGQGGSDAADPGEQAADKPKKTDEPSDAGSGAAASVDVVAASDVANLTAAAEAKGVAAERARTKAVFDSEEGKAHASTAAFLLATSDASASDIIGHLKGLAPVGKTEATTTTSTIPDTKTDIKTDPAAIAGAQGTSADVDKSWDAALEAQAAAHAPIVPAAAAAAVAGAPTITAPALPRTGN